MVAKLEGYTGLVYCQVPLISSDEIRIMVDAVRQLVRNDQNKPVGVQNTFKLGAKTGL